MSERLVTPAEASRIFRVTRTTLRQWALEGKIKYITTKGGHRRFYINTEEKIAKHAFIYARVSSSSQKKDLERQVEALRAEYPRHELIKDVGSGLNFKRPGFQRILRSAIKGTVREIVVTDKDRLCRFGFGIIETILKNASDGKIVVLNQRTATQQEELVEDLISIITVFSSKLYGLRSGRNKKKAKEKQKDQSPENGVTSEEEDGKESDEG